LLRITSAKIIPPSQAISVAVRDIKNTTSRIHLCQDRRPAVHQCNADATYANSLFKGRAPPRPLVRHRTSSLETTRE
jgi:hypothetical protein